MAPYKRQSGSRRPPGPLRESQLRRRAAWLRRGVRGMARRGAGEDFGLCGSGPPPPAQHGVAGPSGRKARRGERARRALRGAGARVTRLARANRGAGSRSRRPASCASAIRCAARASGPPPAAPPRALRASVLNLTCRIIHTGGRSCSSPLMVLTSSGSLPWSGMESAHRAAARRGCRDAAAPPRPEAGAAQALPQRIAALIATVALGSALAAGSIG